MKNHIDMLIFHTDICKGALQISLMADANLRFAALREQSIAPCRETLRNEVEHD